MIAILIVREEVLAVHLAQSRAEAFEKINAWELEAHRDAEVEEPFEPVVDQGQDIVGGELLFGDAQDSYSGDQYQLHVPLS